MINNINLSSIRMQSTGTNSHNSICLRSKPQAMKKCSLLDLTKLRKVAKKRDILNDKPTVLQGD